MQSAIGLVLVVIAVFLPTGQMRSVEKGSLDLRLDQEDHFEGDVLLSTEQQNTLYMRNGILPSLRWPASDDGLVRIHYKTDIAWNLQKMKMLITALEEIEENTCIRFVTADSKTKNFINLINDTGCYSYVGRVGGQQVLSLLDTDGYGPHCWHHKTVVHEFMHAIGLWHEQSRYDRDGFLEIHYENVDASKQHNFDKVTQDQSSTYGVRFNYDSVMHYGKTAFTMNGKVTIVTKDPAYQDVIGNAKVGHPLDYEKIRKIYGCKNTPSKVH